MFVPRKKDEPIISSLMDIDFYKIAMLQVIYLLHRDVRVQFAFSNRTKDVRLANIVDVGEVRAHFQHVQGLTFGNSDLHYLRGTDEYDKRMFNEDFLTALRTLQLPNPYLMARTDGQFHMGVDSTWFEGSLWETIMLAIVSELYIQKQLDKLSRFEQDRVWANAQIRLAEKIDMLKAAWDRGVRFTLSDFGTRRRASGAWQDYVVSAFKAELPKEMFKGTSNILLANKYDLIPTGTNAHEMPMVYSGIYHDEDDANFAAGKHGLPSLEHFLDDWERIYEYALTIALPDTFGSDYFYDHIFGIERLKRWKGSRHDSADPFNYGEMMIARYIKAQIDALTKMITWSDGLNVPLIISLAEKFMDRLKVAGFGLGSNATNDLGFRSLSTVVKAIRANGHGLAKVPDDFAKSIGAPEDIERIMKLNYIDHVESGPVPTY